MNFFIFGVPRGFDIFRGTTDNTDYFLSFYDGSRENAKLTIHRKKNGEVSYSYLRYNFKSSSTNNEVGREGSFFGMSVVFENQYCADAVKLYQLFDTVYYQIILIGEILLKKVTTIPDVQAEFLVCSFKDAPDEINLIESVIGEKIKTAFAKDLIPFDDIEPGDDNVLVEMNIDEGKDAINDAFKKYSLVSISPEFKKQIKFNPTVITKFEKRLATITEFIAEYSLTDLNDKNILTIKQHVEKSIKYIADTKNFIQSYWEKFHSQLSQLSQNLDKKEELLNKLQNRVANSENNTNTDKTGSGDTQKSPAKEDDTGKKPPSKNRLKKFFSKCKSVGIVVGVAALVLLIVFWKPWTTAPDIVNIQQYSVLVNVADSLVQVTPFQFENINEAIKKYQAADTINVVGNNAKSKITKAKEVAVDTLKSRAATEFAKGGIEKTHKIDGYNNAKSKLEEITNEQYGTQSDYESILADYKLQTINYYEAEIKKTEVPVENKKKYANIIVNDLGDCENATVKEMLSNAENSGNINITATDANYTQLSDNTVTYNGTTATFRVKVSNRIGAGMWSSSDTEVSITGPNNADTRVIINNPDDTKSYKLTFTVGQKSNSVTVKTKKQATER
jgi:hypothetical protein